MIKRYLENLIYADLGKKMVFISGPRQVGKTTLAKQIGKDHFSGTYDYLNWDYRQDRKAILKGEFSAEKKLRIFDEIHKYRRWKNYLKGVFDRFGRDIDFLVTGSGRLNIYKRGNDSLFGRYFSYTLLPLSLGELTHGSVPDLNTMFAEFSEPKKEKQEIRRILYVLVIRTSCYCSNSYSGS